jgi:Holliday junction DNA helicase RuvA
MIAGLHGVMRARGRDFVVVGVGGFDVRVFVTTSGLARLGNTGENIHLHTSLYLREDVLALYGFIEEEELALFELLITVSGVGPRLGLVLLSTLQPDALRAAVIQGDELALTRAPGVGRKLAARLILELKPRFRGAPEQPRAGFAPGQSDVIDALVALGVPPAEAPLYAAQRDVLEAGTTNDMVTRALQHYSARRT